MNFMFEWQEQYLTSEHSERVKCCSCQETFYRCQPPKSLCSIQLQNFFVNEGLLYFEEGRNNVAFFIGKINSTLNSDKVGSFKVFLMFKI